MTDLDRLLDFAARSRLPEGGFGYLGDDGRVLPGRPVETWIVARMTHVFGLAQLLGRPGADELVRHGVAALTDGPLHDAEHGGWRASTDDDTKAAYVHAFVVLAGSTAATAGTEGGAGAAAPRPSTIWQDRFWDDDAGLAVEEWDRAGRRLDDYRGVNANMHGVEASLAAADALAGRRRDRRPAARPGAAHHRAGRPRLGPGARLAAARALHRRLGAAARLQPRPAGRPVPPVRRHRRAPVRVGAAGPAPARSARPTRRAGCSTTPSRSSTPRRRGAGRPTGTTASRTRWTGTTGPSSAPACTGCSARRSRRRPCWPRSPASSATASSPRGGGRTGRRPSPTPRTGSWHHELTPTGEVGDRHLGGAARRLPPGPDAAARRPPGPRQRRRRAALMSVGAPRPASASDCPRCSTGPTPGVELQLAVGLQRWCPRQQRPCRAGRYPPARVESTASSSASPAGTPGGSRPAADRPGRRSRLGAVDAGLHDPRSRRPPSSYSAVCSPRYQMLPSASWRTSRGCPPRRPSP